MNGRLLDVEEALSLTYNQKDAVLKDIYVATQRLKGQCLFGLGRLHESITWMEDALKIISSSGNSR